MIDYIDSLVNALWLQTNAADPSNLSFHDRFGISTAVESITTIVVC